MHKYVEYLFMQLLLLEQFHLQQPTNHHQLLNVGASNSFIGQ